MRSRSSGVVHESPSMLGDAPAVLTEPSIPVAPMHYPNRVRSESVRSENDIIRQGTVNNEALAHRVTDEVTSRRSVIPAAAVDLNEGGLQNDSEGEWVRVVRRRGTRTSRFKGERGTAMTDSTSRLKAADTQIPLYIYNVSKENTEHDVAEYIQQKTQIRIVPEKINMKSSFKFL
ncbi:unnamed protein product [Parnassius apollo]|uniref:(apollo) hypothetical protein n=1 Tax=Parnassius apollo TaxID=110799 RepID=A0A8S3Y6Q5_PARAO|nr:unnamed protein product [Parnassius apollo]